MQMSDQGLALLTELEGCAPCPYQDVGGLWSLGVGHLLTKSELASGKILLPMFGFCRYGPAIPWPQSWIEELLRQDVCTTELALMRHVRMPLTQQQYDALCCWCFNVGTDALRTSTLLKRLNAGRYDEIPGQLRRWVYAGGRVVAGLQRRREREITLWLGAGVDR